MHPFLGMDCPCECGAISCRQPTQHLTLGFSPVHYVHGYQLCCQNMCLILKAHMLTQKLFASLSLASICSPHIFQQGSNSLLVMTDGDPAQGISCTIVSSLLVLQSEFKEGECTYPSVPSGIKVWGGEDVVNGLLSVCTTNSMYARYSLRCSVTLNLRKRNSDLEL